MVKTNSNKKTVFLARIVLLFLKWDRINLRILLDHEIYFKQNTFENFTLVRKYFFEILFCSVFCLDEPTFQ